jgi:hypothetical protein
MGYLRSFLIDTPMLAGLVLKDNAEDIELNNNVTIEVATCSYKTIRGRTVIAGLCDEVAFWAADEMSANPDTEVLGALRPAMATVPGSMLLLASSPYARRGALWETYRRHFGRDDSPVLVWRAASREMNELVPERLIAEAYENDAASAAAEYGAEFRTDVETFIAREIVEAAVARGVFERPAFEGVRYVGFTDPSGGSSDSMVTAIAHRENGVILIDAIHEARGPFQPSTVVAEQAEMLKRYGVHTTIGHRYGGAWPSERFRECGIRYEVCEQTRSELYLSLLPELNSSRVQLLDNKRLVAQLCGLERHTARSGKDSIDHAPGQKDDVANAVAGAVSLLVNQPTPTRSFRFNWMVRPRDSI